MAIRISTFAALIAYFVLIAYLVFIASPKYFNNYCYNLDKNRTNYMHFSTKTAYQLAKGYDDKDFVIPNCTPSKLWLFIRHGTRYPSAKLIKRFMKLEDLRDKIISNYETNSADLIGDGLCANDINLLKQWKWNAEVTADQANNLAKQGWDDLRSIARKYQRLFPTLLGRKYDPQKYNFKYTRSPRTEGSFKAFVEELFVAKNVSQIDAAVKSFQTDKILKPYRHCTSWKQRAKELKQSNSEMQKFENLQIYQQIIKDVSIRLGFNSSLGHQDVKDIFDLCRFDLAWRVNSSSPWCSAFTPDQIQIFEYKEDLKYFYKTGYGVQSNSNLSCFTVSDLLQHLNSPNQPNAIVYFTHSTAVQLLLNALGLFKDADTLRADNYVKMRQRKWKTSEMSPFSANLAAIKYNCTHLSKTDAIKFRFFLNEKPLTFDWCANGLCNLTDLLISYRKYRTEDCEKFFCDGIVEMFKSIDDLIDSDDD